MISMYGITHEQGETKPIYLNISAQENLKLLASHLSLHISNLQHIFKVRIYRQ